MDSNFPVSNYVTKFLSEYIYGYIDLDDTTSVLILQFDKSKNEATLMQQKTSNLTTNIFLRFLSTTRTGSAHKHVGISLEKFLLTILLSIVWFVFQMTIFCLLRNVLKSIYQGRKALLSETDIQRTNVRHRCWPMQLFMASNKKYIESCGLDAYLFLRYVSFLIFYFFTLALLNVPILIPINYLSGNNNMDLQLSNKTGNEFLSMKNSRLDRINMSNISLQNSNNLLFHMIMGIFSIIWFHVLLTSELKHVNELAHYEKNLREYQSVIFIDNIPSEFHDHEKFMNFLKWYSSNSVKHITFIPKNFKLLQKYDRRLQQLQRKMEAVILKIVLEKHHNAMKERRHNKLSLRSRIHFVVQSGLFKLKTFERFFSIHMKIENLYLRRPLPFKIPYLSAQIKPFINILYSELALLVMEYHAELVEFDNILEEFEQEKIGGICRSPNMIENRRTLRKAFIHFNSALNAQIFGQYLASKKGDTWNNIIIGPNPQDMVWWNINADKRVISPFRTLIAGIISTLVIIGWVIPVAFIGLVSQIPSLANLIPYPSQLNTKSEFLSEMISGVFPIITLVFLTEFAPFIFRWLSYFKGIGTGSNIEVDTQYWYFMFLFVHIFLVVTVSSSISFLIERILNNPVSLPTLLAQDLPKSSNFFCSFVLLRGIAYAGGNFLRLKELCTEVFYYCLVIKGPRSQIRRMKNNLFFQWGSIYPIFTVLGCIGIIYSVISPLVLPLCCISFLLVYFSFKYLFEFQCNQKNISETFGKIYIQALMQLYAGIYFMEFCLIGLFALYNNYMMSTFMVLIFLLTLMVHYNISRRYSNAVNNISNLYEQRDRDLKTSIANENDLELQMINANHFYSGKEDLWLPSDSYGIADHERYNLERQFNLKCDLSKAFIDDLGTMKLTQL